MNGVSGGIYVNPEVEKIEKIYELLRKRFRTPMFAVDDPEKFVYHTVTDVIKVCQEIPLIAQLDCFTSDQLALE